MRNDGKWGRYLLCAVGEKGKTMANRLINETSPYLQQHAQNPVDWYAWDPEALERAKKENKPIFLSIGYSACHWCHVMEHESFENEEIAALMNENFVSIKVDREERPDLDSVYVEAVRLMTGSAGWPLSVFLTPDGKPFYGGTYFPPEDRGGMVGFSRLLKSVSEFYNTRRGDVVKATEQLLSMLRQSAAITHNEDPLTEEIMSEAFQALTTQFDRTNGGFGVRPKFPQPMILEFLYRYFLRTGNEEARLMADLTLGRMALGGIYDQVGGGFHRYSTDPFWLVPHFEKMLYDNALLVRLYLHGYQLTKQGIYQRIAEETLDYVIREMTDPAGGFYSAQDADSEGVEGKYFVWRPEEVKQVLGDDEGDLVCKFFDVTEVGNFEESNILHVPHKIEELAQQLGLTEEDLTTSIFDAQAKLLEVRQSRIAPDRDEKVLTCWNGLMLKSFAEAASILGEERFLQAAVKNADFILTHLRQDGKLLRSYKDGATKVPGFLSDYAFLADGLLALHEATFDRRWLDEAINLGEEMVRLFWDELTGVFYDSSKEHESLVMRPRDFYDNALPSSSSVAVEVLLRLAVLTGDQDYRRRASVALRAMREHMAKLPTGMGHWLCALDFYLSSPKEVVVVGPRTEEGTRSLLSEIFSPFLPNKVVLGQESDSGSSDEKFPLLQGRVLVDGKPTVYVCENYTCQMPVTSAEALAQQLQS